MFEMLTAHSKLPEAELIEKLFEYEGIPLTVNVSMRASKETSGTKLLVVLKDGQTIGDFYDVVEYFKNNGLVRC